VIALLDYVSTSCVVIDRTLAGIFNIALAERARAVTTEQVVDDSPSATMAGRSMGILDHAREGDNDERSHQQTSHHISTPIYEL
jgi:hypothetical protein